MSGEGKEKGGEREEGGGDNMKGEEWEREDDRMGRECK